MTWIIGMLANEGSPAKVLDCLEEGRLNIPGVKALECVVQLERWVTVWSVKRYWVWWKFAAVKL